jgi:hypothetical protein
MIKFHYVKRSNGWYYIVIDKKTIGWGVSPEKFKDNYLSKESKDVIIGVIGVVYILFCFYGINWLSSYLLPKWVDIMIGFPLSMYLIYKGTVYFANTQLNA